jgi:hypothetical protein
MNTDRLALVADEFARAVGRSTDELNSQREKALQYIKGVMDDVPSLPGRSSACSTDVADAIEMVLPDLIEIFTGEDIATFMPVGPEDEDAAQQETDYVKHVFFEENPGFLNLYSAIKDAVSVKTGIFKAWGEEYEEPEEEFEDQSIMQFASAVQKHGDRVELKSELGDLDDPEGTVDFCIRKQEKWRARVMAVPPEDFGVSKDTVRLAESPYCFHKTRLRAYELKKRGIDAAKVDALPAYGVIDNQVAQARDRVDETVDDRGGLGDHRIVEVVEHYLDGPDGRYRLLTDGSSLTLLEEEEHPDVPFAALTPYIVPHQFYGESVSDRLIEIQKINTVLTRMTLDSGYFALNQRMYVNMDKANDWTISDLLRNEPNVPVRGKGDNAIVPLTSGGLSFDTLSAIEHFSTMGEKRTGIVRNAQGLNPDTLHDTARGALALMSESQKRVRLIASILAHTGIKDIFLLLHRLLRKNATAAETVRLRGKWVDLDPSTWGNRADMVIEIGVGSAGKEAEQMRMQAGLATIEAIIDRQGGLNGPLVTADNAYAYLKRYFEKGLDFKSADAFITDPSAPPKEGEQPPEPPPPDPALLEARAKMQMAQQEAQAKQELAQQQAQADVQLAQVRAQAEIETARAIAQEKSALARAEAEERALLKRQENAEAMQMKREMAAFDLQHKREVAQVELDQRAREIELEAMLKESAIRLNAESESQKIDGSTVGGEPG